MTCVDDVARRSKWSAARRSTRHTVTRARTASDAGGGHRRSPFAHAASVGCRSRARPGLKANACHWRRTQRVLERFDARALFIAQPIDEPERIVEQPLVAALREEAVVPDVASEDRVLLQLDRRQGRLSLRGERRQRCEPVDEDRLLPRWPAPGSASTITRARWWSVCRPIATSDLSRARVPRSTTTSSTWIAGPRPSTRAATFRAPAEGRSATPRRSNIDKTVSIPSDGRSRPAAAIAAVTRTPR